MKKKKTIFRGVAFLLALAIVTGLVFCVANARANVHIVYGSTSGKTIAGLGTNIIADPNVPANENIAWTGSYVYFGTYNGSPVKYRVLDSNTTVYGGTTMLLDCDSILWKGSNPSSAFDADSNVWADSDIRAYLNGTFLTDNFSILEQNAIAESTVASHQLTTDSDSKVDVSDWVSSEFVNYVALDKDKVFLLDAEDVSNEKYGYCKYRDFIIKNRRKSGVEASWWLRSADTDDRIVGYVTGNGNISFSSVHLTVGVSPALNVNLQSVLFSSVISGTAGKAGAEYKLTLLDNDMTIAVNGTVTRKGDVITVPYIISGTNSANASQVSVLILDKEYTAGNTNNANVLAYGGLDADTGKFTLPSELTDKVCGSDYYAYIVAEDVNGEKETDYASTPVKITIIEEITENTETEETTTVTEKPTKTPETEETTTVKEDPTKTPEKEQPTTVIEETTTTRENATEENTTESTTEESSSEEQKPENLTTEESTSAYEEETTAIILGDNSTENETTSTVEDISSDNDDFDKGGNGWIIGVVLGIVILFAVILIFLFIFKKKKNKEKTEENKDM